MHQGAKDNITQLDAKTNYGRPKWDDIFKGIANEHSGWVEEQIVYKRLMNLIIFTNRVKKKMKIKNYTVSYSQES